MKSTQILFTLTIVLGSLPVAAQTAPNLTVNGSAKLVPISNGGNAIVLTPPSENQAGSAFTTDAVKLSAVASFNTFFQFRMQDPGGLGAADGLAFVIQTEGATALGGGGGSLGYAGITPSVAVEFDTWNNGGFDADGNHVAILTLGQLNDTDSQPPYGVTNCASPTGVFGCLGNGDIWSVWIDYDGTTLNVAVADNSTTRPANLISYPIDIAGLLGQTSAYVGFTGATGGGSERHEINTWEFSATKAP